MRLAFRLFSAFLLLEMMCLYHCFGQDVSKVSYVNPSHIYGNIDQVSPSDFSFMDLVEFLEGKDGDESSEEDSHQTDSSDQIYFVSKNFRFKIYPKDEIATHRLLNFKKNKSPLFVLFHSWKYHIV